MKIALLKLFDLQLTKLSTEISLYADEDALWKSTSSVPNSGGNLCLHLIGNLNHFIGATLGNTGYIRHRDDEFSLKGIAIKQLKAQIESTKQVIKKTIESLNDTDFDKIYPITVFGTEMTTTYFLIHLTGHLNYHLGQLNYHRRLIC